MHIALAFVDLSFIVQAELFYIISLVLRFRPSESLDSLVHASDSRFSSSINFYAGKTGFSFILQCDLGIFCFRSHYSISCNG